MLSMKVVSLISNQAGLTSVDRKLNMSWMIAKVLLNERFKNKFSCL
jgi:hypothetical protein